MMRSSRWSVMAGFSATGIHIRCGSGKDLRCA